MGLTRKENLPLLIDSNRRTGTDGAERKESIVDALIDLIQFGLESIKELMQTARDDLTGIRVSQLGAQLAEALLGGVSIHSNRRAGNRMK